MTDAPCSPVARAVRSVLGIVLLALACLAGLAAIESPAPPPAGTEVATVLPSDAAQFVGAVERPGVAAPPGEGPYHGDPVGLLCLCALLVAGILLSRHRPFRRRAPHASPGVLESIARGTAPYVALTSPLVWGISRT